MKKFISILVFCLTLGFIVTAQTIEKMEVYYLNSNESVVSVEVPSDGIVTFSEENFILGFQHQGVLYSPRFNQDEEQLHPTEWLAIHNFNKINIQPNYFGRQGRQLKLAEASFYKLSPAPNAQHVASDLFFAPSTATAAGRIHFLHTAAVSSDAYRIKNWNNVKLYRRLTNGEFVLAYERNNVGNGNDYNWNKPNWLVGVYKIELDGNPADRFFEVYEGMRNQHHLFVFPAEPFGQ